MHEACFFVPSRETGEAIVSMFEKGARLDYRPSEPKWIQVKINACDDHYSSLVSFVGEVEQTRLYQNGPGISRELVKKYSNPYLAVNEKAQEILRYAMDEVEAYWECARQASVEGDTAEDKRAMYQANKWMDIADLASTAMRIIKNNHADK